MPTPPLESPSTKVTINLFQSDVDWLRRNEDHWTASVRELIQCYVYAKQHGTDFIDIRGID